MWEQFASSYTDMMFEAMERTVKQSQTLKEQLNQATERTLKAWQLPAQSDQQQVMEALNNLQAHIQALTVKVERLEQAVQAKMDKVPEESEPTK
jgi:chromosome segregation ATPase